MQIQVLKQLFQRDLNKLQQEISAYQSEQQLWVVEKNIPNSAGNLCLHLVGNIQHFIGKVLGGTDFVRDRPSEFALKNVPKAALIKQVEETMAVVDAALDKLTEEDLEKEYPIVVFEEKTSTGYLLIHLAMHLDYHLGQINYHRRLLDV
ncbi:MAG TPA: DinB family protein [Chitinophaga sp.]|uniref:DinB family protein n=1 Tax=Chitinophaga sp. TaxID=1869181 RepID=UPI002F934632